jgi:hypothetical protein
MSMWKMGLKEMGALGRPATVREAFLSVEGAQPHQTMRQMEIFGLVERAPGSSPKGPRGKTGQALWALTKLGREVLLGFREASRVKPLGTRTAGGSKTRFLATWLVPQGSFDPPETVRGAL